MADEKVLSINKSAAAQGGLTEQGFAEQAKDWEPVPAHERLAAVLEKHLGKDFVLHNGKPEMGVGSPYSMLHPAHKAHIAAIEHLIVVEAEHAAAEKNLKAIHAKVEHAMKHVEATEKEASNG
jgi:hypothetical protein